MEALLQWINPLRYLTGEEYAGHWRNAFATVLQGFWGRFLAVTFLFLSFWFGVRRRNFAMATLFFVLAVIVTFASPLLGILGLL